MYFILLHSKFFEHWQALKKTNVTQIGLGKNPTTNLYSEATKPENVFDEKKAIRKQKILHMLLKIMHLRIMLKWWILLI